MVTIQWISSLEFKLLIQPANRNLFKIPLEDFLLHFELFNVQALYNQFNN